MPPYGPAALSLRQQYGAQRVRQVSHTVLCVGTTSAAGDGAATRSLVFNYVRTS